MKKAKKILIFMIAGVFLILSRENIQAADFTLDDASWSQISAGGPSARRGHSAVYASSDTMIIFGGFEGPNYKNDVWKLKDGTWTEIVATADPEDGSPKTRADHSAVWTGNDMIIFGGWNHNVDDAVYRDVWVLKNALSSPQWERKGVAPTPSNYGLRGSSAVWTGSRMVIFGGLRDDARVYNRTMIYDPNNTNWSAAWDTLNGGPDPRYKHSAVYDGGSSMYIFGGRGASHAQRNDMWKLNLGNNEWNEIIVNSAGSGPYNPPKPFKRADHSAFFDSGNNQMLIFGGMTPGGNLSNDVWALKMSDLTWKQIFPSGTSPGARSDQAGIYDGADDVIIFGGDKQGAGNHGDTWKLHFSPPPEPPCVPGVSCPPGEEPPPTIMDFSSYCTGSSTALFTLYWTNHTGNVSSNDPDYNYRYTKQGEAEVNPIVIPVASLDARGFRWQVFGGLGGGIYTFKIGHSSDSHIGPSSVGIQIPDCSPTLRIAPAENIPVTDLGDGSYFAHTGVSALKFLAYYDIDGSDPYLSENDVTPFSGTVWTANSSIIEIGDTPGENKICDDFTSLGNLRKGCVRNIGGEGTASFTVTKNSITDTATIEFDNQTPVATDFPISTNEDTSVSINMRDYNGDGTFESYDPDTAHDDSSLAYSIVVGPANGALSGSGNTRTYTPNSNYNGTDSFTYKVTDLHGKESSVKTVSITVNSVNDTPTVNAGADASVNENTAFTTGATASDVDGDTLTYSWSCNPAGIFIHGANTLNPSGTTPSVTSNTGYDCTLAVNDGHGGSNSDTVTTTVVDVPEIPGNTAPTALLDIENNSETTITAALANETVYLDVSGSTDDNGITGVRFCSDLTPADSTCDNSWSPATSYHPWDSNSGNWNKGTKEMSWSFADAGVYEVYAEVTDGSLSDLDEKTITISPTAPSLTPTVGCEGTGDAKVDLSWTNSAGETGYRVYRKTGVGGVYSQVGSDLLKDTVTYTDNSAVVSTTYYYKVTALGGNNTDSNESSATTGSCPPGPINQVPTADADVTANNDNPPAGTDYTEVTVNEGSDGVTPLVYIWGDNSTDSDGTISTYSWDCGGVGAIGSSTSANTTFNPPDNITANTDYTCTLTVTDDDGATDTESVTVHVNNYESPTLGVELSPNPTTSPGALRISSLSSKVTGTATGLASFRYDCTDDGSWDHAYTEANGNGIDLTVRALAIRKYDDEDHEFMTYVWAPLPPPDDYSVFDISLIFNDICVYTELGDHTIRVRIERGGAWAEDTATVTVTQNPPDFSVSFSKTTYPYLLEPNSFWNNLKFIGGYFATFYHSFAGPVNFASPQAGNLKKCTDPWLDLTRLKCQVHTGAALDHDQESLFNPTSVSVSGGSVDSMFTYPSSNMAENARGNVLTYTVSGVGSPGTRESSPYLNFGVNRLPVGDFVYKSDGLKISIADNGSYDPDRNIITNAAVQGENPMIAAADFDGAGKYDKCYIDSIVNTYYPIGSPQRAALENIIEDNCEGGVAGLQPNPPTMDTPWSHTYLSPGIYDVKYTIVDDLLGVSIPTVKGVPTNSTLTVSVLGAEIGRVESNISGVDGKTINCGNVFGSQVCSTDFPHNTFVQLTATPNTGISVGAWGGACAGSDNNAPCFVTMNDDKIVTKEFFKPTLMITPADISTLRIGETRDFSAEYDPDGGSGPQPPQSVTTLVTWVATDQSGWSNVASFGLPAGRITANNRGVAEISASYNHDSDPMTPDIESDNKPLLKVIKYKWQEK